MAARDWFTDCSNLVIPHICRIASVVIPVLFGVLVWYAGRIEGQMAEVNDTLVEIQIAVGRPGVGPPQPAPRRGIAMSEPQ